MNSTASGGEPAASRRDGRVALRPSDRFRIASVTKVFIATLVLQLVAADALKLEHPVERFLPGVLPGGDRIRVRHLLNHTSGLFDYMEDRAVLAPYERDPSFLWQPRDLVALAANRPLLHAPGARWAYSNTNYVALGLIAEEVVGEPLSEQLRKRIFEPLGLRRTMFATTPHVDGRFMHAYIRDRSGRLADTSGVSPSFAWASGAIVSSANDVVRFLSALLGGKLLPPPLLKAMRTTVPVRDDYFISAYGHGLYAMRTSCGLVWGHDGEMFGYQAAAFARERGRRVVVVAANASGEPWWVKSVVEAALCP